MESLKDTIKETSEQFLPKMENSSIIDDRISAFLAGSIFGVFAAYGFFKWTPIGRKLMSSETDD